MSPQSLEGAGQTSVGLEMIQVQALTQIFDNLSNQLQRQASFWNPLDRRLADKLRLPYEPTWLELPPQSCYYSGTRLGIIGLPWDMFPALAVMADSGAATADGSTYSAGAGYSISLYIEAIVRSDSFDQSEPDPTPEQRVERVKQEGLVDRRAKRMMEAIIQCIAISRTLDGLVPELPPPSFGQTDPFILEGTRPGDMSQQRVFSMVRIQYNPGLFALWPDASRSAPPVLPGGFGV